MFKSFTTSNVFSFMWKRAISLYWNLGASELVLFVLFVAFPSHNQLLGCCWDNKLHHPVVRLPLLLFPFERQKELYDESWWSAQRGINWQHSHSYIVAQPTDLFYHTILLFAKSSMLINFNPHPRKHWANTQPHDLPVEKGISVTPPKVWVNLLLKIVCHGRRGNECLCTIFLW